MQRERHREGREAEDQREHSESVDAHNNLPLNAALRVVGRLDEPSEGRRAMCSVSDASSVRGGRSTRASHQSRPRSLPPPRTDASPKPRRYWARRRTQPLVAPRLLTGGRLRFVSPGTHAVVLPAEPRTRPGRRDHRSSAHAAPATYPSLRTNVGRTPH